MSRMKKNIVVIALICSVLTSSVSASAIPTTTSNEGVMLRLKNLYLFTVGSYIEQVSNSNAEFWKEQVKKKIQERDTNAVKNGQHEEVEKSKPVEESQPIEKPVEESRPVEKEGQLELTFEEEVLKIMNHERAKLKASTLVFDDLLNKVALDKAKDLYELNYFAHHSPTYGSLSEMLDLYGVEYMSAAENIAKGQKSADQVMEAWLNSAGHNKNMMNSNYHRVGIAYYEGLWVQIFTN